MFIEKIIFSIIYKSIYLMMQLKIIKLDIKQNTNIIYEVSAHLFEIKL